MRRALALLALAAGCGSTSVTPYGKFALETHSRDLGSSCLSDSHSHLLGPGGERLLEPLSLFEPNGTRLWAVAAGGRDPERLSLLDLEGGRVHSTHESGELRWSASREHLLLERAGGLRLFSFEPLRLRTLFREDGAFASVRELGGTFWAPDGTGLAFFVSTGRRAGPTRLFHARFDGADAREVGRSPRAPHELTISWEGSLPALD